MAVFGLLCFEVRRRFVKGRRLRRSSACTCEDVFAEAEDGGRQRARVAPELAQQVAHLERLLEVPALIHVDRLQRLAAREVRLPPRRVVLDGPVELGEPLLERALAHEVGALDERGVVLVGRVQAVRGLVLSWDRREERLEKPRRATQR